MIVQLSDWNWSDNLIGKISPADDVNDLKQKRGKADWGGQNTVESLKEKTDIWSGLF